VVSAGRDSRQTPDRESRAVAGLSMGGAQALYAGLDSLDQFWRLSLRDLLPRLFQEV
jgi:enterochelin esterase-like enzyme